LSGLFAVRIRSGAIFAFGRLGRRILVVPHATELLQLELPSNRAAASAVRDAMSRMDGLGWVLGDAMLVATELVNNAVTHSGCDDNHALAVTIHRERDGIVISVRDPGCAGRADAVLCEAVEVGGGLGLVIVDALARRWGADRDQGYHVWAELAVEDTS
jgi:C4-dicarboxylate-specific signal transduction histidine kinase